MDNSDTNSSLKMRVIKSSMKKSNNKIENTASQIAEAKASIKFSKCEIEKIRRRRGNLEIQMAELMVEIAVERASKRSYSELGASSPHLTSDHLNKIHLTTEEILKFISESSNITKQALEINRKKLSEMLLSLDFKRLLDVIYILAHLHKKYNSNKINDQKSFKFYTLAGTLGHAKANSQLDRLYKSNKHLNCDQRVKSILFKTEVIPDLSLKDITTLKKALVNNSTKAFHDLAIYYMRSGDYENAIINFLESIDRGNEENMYDLALCYEKNTPKNYKNAFSLYLKLADKGDVNALYSLASYYDYGYGVDEDKNWAVMLYQRAAQQGHKLAKSRMHLIKLGKIVSTMNMAYRFKLGNGVPQDNNQAIKLYKQAAEEGSLRAIHELAEVYEEIGDKEEAISLFQQACDKDFEPAIFSLAERYEHGNGVPKDLKKAVDLYKKSAKKGSAVSNARLKSLEGLQSS